MAYERALSAEEEERLPGELKKMGMEVNVLTPEQTAVFKKRVQPVYDMMRDAIGAGNMSLMLAEVEKAGKEAAKTGKATKKKQKAKK